MAQKVGLGKYLKHHLKRMLTRTPSPSSSSGPRPASRPKPAPSFGNYKSNYSSTLIINGKKYTGQGKGGTYVKNGKVLKPGTPEYDDFKKEMDEFSKEMTQFGLEMGKMGRDMGTSAREAADNIRRAFHDKD